jgi:hypothetical protein
MSISGNSEPARVQINPSAAAKPVTDWYIRAVIVSKMLYAIMPPIIWPL